MGKSSIWQKVTKRRPCPVCGRPDWCMFVGPEDSPTAVICPRVESPNRCGEGGWLHVLRNDGPTWAPWRRSFRVAVRMMSEPSKVDFAKLAEDYCQAVKPVALDALAAALGVSVESLRRLGVGWSAQHQAWAFPMQDAGGDVLGIRLRLTGGKKLSVKGGREGLFLPNDFARVGGRLLIAEGPTDTAALLDLGFSTIGRPSCTGGVKLLVKLVQHHRPKGMVIVADADANAAGQRGAESLAAVLVAYASSVRVITPPAGVKDAREWKRSGATHADVQAAISVATVRKLSITTKIRKTRRDGKRGEQKRRFAL